MPAPSPADSAARRPWEIFLLLAVVALVGNYFYGRYFGIYEDDYFYTIPAFQWSWSDCWAHIRADAVSWPQGRVVAYVCNDLLSWLSAQGSSLELGYAFGAVLLVNNTWLCYRLASTWFPPLGAFAAAAVYALNPADTAKVILMHRTFLLLGSTLLLTALLSYRLQRYWLAYLAAALSLLTYESFFFPFLAAPLLLVSWPEFSWRRVLLHGAACAGVLGAVILIRAGMGEARITESMGTLSVLVNKISHAVMIGPWTCLRTLVARPLDALRYSGPGQWGFMLALVLVALGVFPQRGTAGFSRREARDRGVSFLIFAAGCLLVLGLCYVVAIHPGNYPPVVTIGRLSGFNAPAAIPLGLLVGALVTALTGANRSRVVVGLVGLYLGTLLSFGLEVQRVDYVTNWQQQKNYWREVLATSGEWTPGVVVLVQIEGTEGRPATPGFPPFWMANYPPLLGQWLVNAPGLTAGASRPARVFAFHAAMKAPALGAGFQLKTPPWGDASLWPVLHDRSFIYFNFADGHLARKTEPVIVGDTLLTPKPIPATPVPPLTPTHLSHMLFDSPALWPTIARALNYPP